MGEKIKTTKKMWFVNYFYTKVSKDLIGFFFFFNSRKNNFNFPGRNERELTGFAMKDDLPCHLGLGH